MRSVIYISKSFSILLFTFATLCIPYQITNAQTGYCTVLQQPCDSDGVLVTTVSGFTPPLTFDYGFYTHSSIMSLTDTLYNISGEINYVWVSDNLGHYQYISSGIIPPFYVDFPLSITQPICPNTIGSIQVTIDGGNFPTSVDWYQGNFMNPGPYVGTGNPMNLPLGTYCAYVTDINGCGYFYRDSSITMYQLSPISFNVNTTDANCTDGTASINNISGGIPPYTYNWSNGANTYSINNLSSGYYYVTAYDAQGCHTMNYFNINQTTTINVNSSVTNATCLNNNGSVISFGSGGTPPYSYQYSNGAITQNVGGLIGSANIWVTVTDANGCTGHNSSIYIGTNTPIWANYTTTPCSCTAPTGSATLTISGGTAPYSVIWYTNPQQTGTTIANMPAGTYSFKVTDAVGCIRTGIVPIESISNFYVQPIPTYPICPNNNGAITLYDYGSSNPPFTYLWNNGATTSTITNLTPGTYYCTITDNLGCTTTKCQNLWLNSPVHIGFNTTPASCLYNHDGIITAVPTGGTPPYTYFWSTGQNTATITGLEKGNYWVNIIDANGCSKWDTTYLDYDHFNDSCYCTITGRVFVDNNSNCTYDSGEELVEHIMIHCSPFGYSFTNNQGIYTFKVPTGNYNLSEVVQYIYPLAPCQNNLIPLSINASTGCIISNDFANIINPLHDIHLRTINFNHAEPGLNYYQALIVKNDGTVPESNIQFSNTHDGQLQYINTSPVALTQPDPINEPNWYNITSGFPTLNPGQGTMLLTRYFVPTDIPLATTINFWDTTAYNTPMNNWLTDYTPWNNVNDTDIIVVGPYDPNYKEVSPRGIGSEGYISNSDSILDFIIHFQNIGNYYAHNIVIIDTLDPNLDITSLRPGFSNKNYVAEVSEDRILKFTFNNANLYPKSWDEILSCGLICYSVKLNPSLNPGTQIKNSANIYFDYNSPIKTNATLNTIQMLNINPSTIESNLYIYPNPASTIINVNTTTGLTEIKSIYIYEISGRLILTKDALNSDVQKINIESLTKGIYFITIERKTGEKQTFKFIKE